jgi:cytochrome c5
MWRKRTVYTSEQVAGANYMQQTPDVTCCHIAAVRQKASRGSGTPVARPDIRGTNTLQVTANMCNNTFVYGQDWRGMRQAWRRREMHIGFGLQKLKEKYSLEDLNVERRIILKSILRNFLFLYSDNFLPSFKSSCLLEMSIQIFAFLVC